MSDKNIAKHIVHYRNVFIYLLIGTALTVGASYLEFSVQNSIAGAIFVGLSGYALATRKDFSFMGGFLFAGILVAFLAGIGAAIFALPTLSLVVSGMFVILMSGLILYQTSAMIHGGETNYILATVTLYVSIYNLFMSLLHLLALFSGRD